jgi:hypothetical protein
MPLLFAGDCKSVVHSLVCLSIVACRRHGTISITFGDLLVAYQDIPDSLVGVLETAREHNLVDFYTGACAWGGAWLMFALVLTLILGVDVSCVLQYFAQARQQELALRQTCRKEL